MRYCLLIVIAFVFPVISQAEHSMDEFQPREDKRVVICDQLSDSQCFGREVDSVCLVEAQKGQTGFCRGQTIPSEVESVTCYCR